MIEDALLEAQKLDEGLTDLAGKAINGIKNAFSGNKGQQQNNGQQQDGNQNQQQDAEQQNDGQQTEQQEQPAQAPDIETLKGYLKENPKIDDWPADRLGELVAFLQTQKAFMSSKSAQAALQAIQGQEQKAKAEGKTEAPADAKQQQPAANKGDPSKVTGPNATLVDTILNRGISKDDLIAYINNKK